MEIFIPKIQKNTTSYWQIIILSLSLILVSGCASSNYSVSLPGTSLRTGSVKLEKRYIWNPLLASDFILGYGVSEQGNLYQFYKKHDFNPLWLSHGSLNNNSKELLKSLNTTWKEGLSGKNYNVEEIHEMINELRGAQEMTPATMKKIMYLDIMFTNAYLEYAADLYIGKVNPDRLDSIWEALPQSEDLMTILDHALSKNQVARSLEELKPDNRAYDMLTDKMEQYMEIKVQGGWIQPGYFPVLEYGDTSANIIHVKKFFKISGDLRDVDSLYMRSPWFDEILTDAVMEFQHRHGLYVDGVIGRNTLSSMNYSVDQRIDKIRANLERLRWLPDDLGEKYILVNLPEYKLRYYENDKIASEMKIIIGEIENSTPVLKDTLQYIVFNPTWRLPRSIAVEEVLPKIKSDSTYLNRNKFSLLKGSYLSKDTIHPDSVDWTQIEKDNFPFYIVRKPGPANPLGRVKFLFPNYHAIYLHDTPATHMFNYRERHFSHGCIRLERPFELASLLLNGRMTEEEISEVVESKETQSVIVPDEILVHFIYQTAWVDEQKKIHFRDDIYYFDKMTLERLEKGKLALNSRLN